MRINQLRNQGTRLEVLEMAENWISENIDELFKGYQKKQLKESFALRKSTSLKNFNSFTVAPTQA
jgi:hypothetical protein